MAKVFPGKNPNKPWTVRYYHQGHQRERSFRTKREADDFRVKFEHDSREHSFVDPRLSAEKFSHAAEKWISRLTGSDSTKAAYRRALRHLEPELGQHSILQVSRERDVMQDLLLVKLPEQGLSRSTIQVVYAVANGTINDAIKGGRLATSRIGRLRLPAQSQRAEFEFPPHTQLASLAELLDDLGNMIWLMRGCGLRAGEALAVQYEDFHPGVLRVARQVRPDGSLGPLKHRKPGEYRDVPVPDFVQRKIGPGEDRLFPPVVRSTFDRRFRLSKLKVGLSPSFTPHSLRHIFASIALAGGVPITDVSRWLGHRDINVTFSIYGHLVPSSWESARNVLDSEYADYMTG